MRAKLSHVYQCDATGWDAETVIGMEANRQHIMAAKRVERGDLAKYGTQDYKDVLAILKLIHYGDDRAVQEDMAKFMEAKTKQECDAALVRSLRSRRK